MTPDTIATKPPTRSFDTLIMVDALASLRRRDALEHRAIMSTTPPDQIAEYWRARRAFRAAQRHERPGATPNTFRRLMAAGQRLRYVSLAIYRGDMHLSTIAAHMREWGWDEVEAGPHMITLRISCAIATLQYEQYGVGIRVDVDDGSYGAAVYAERWYKPESFRDWLESLTSAKPN